jgi:hypothetical protein
LDILWLDYLPGSHCINSSGKLVWVAVFENIVQNKKKFKEKEFAELAHLKQYTLFQQKSLELYELEKEEELEKMENAQFFASLGVITLKSPMNDKYVCVEKNGALVCNRDKEGEWEQVRRASGSR